VRASRLLSILMLLQTRGRMTAQALVELAHRVQSLEAMSNNRLILGVGSGSKAEALPALPDANSVPAA
jgi:alkanesulfonate monooxygenase SsuD/methylene tetrahydromethanopterin reductase-like flavin-dependent oxidoreductase (luciferase family)